jgi:hypothetical protein
MAGRPNTLSCGLRRMCPDVSAREAALRAQAAQGGVAAAKSSYLKRSHR